jgi:hypothetical protein
MLAASSLTDHGTNSNDTLGAETVMMLKEQITETYGEIRYTMSDGCSGGSIMQQSIASGYPGLLDGIQPNCSFPDTMTTGIEIADCGVLQDNYYKTANGSTLTGVQMSAINGHLNTGFCAAWISSFLPLLNPSRGANCGNLPASVVYDPVLRPNGVRCTSSDHAVGMLGTFIDTDGNTKANQPGDNVGLQYGLKALQAGTIAAEDFVKLNQGVGGYTADAKWTGPATIAPRQAATSTSVLDTIYSAGIVSDGRQLAKLPIIDLRGNQSAAGDIHMNWRPWAVRDRLDRDFGDHGNQLIFAYTGGGGAGAPGAALVLKSFTTLDTWLANIEKDTSNQPIEAKVRANQPPGAADLCVTTNGANEADVVAAVALDAPTCPVKFQGSPRQAAGGPLAENVFKCTLKPLNFSDPDYAGITFTEDQQSRLAGAFPSGVCDWSKPGVGQVASAGGTTYKAGPGGQPFGAEPDSALGTSLLTALNSAKVWVGIKNSDDVGTFFDVRADAHATQITPAWRARSAIFLARVRWGMSIIWPFQAKAPAPRAACSSNAAMRATASSAASREGVNSWLMASSWPGWIEILPVKLMATPSRHSRLKPSTSAISVYTVSMASTPAADAATAHMTRAYRGMSR